MRKAHPQKCLSVIYGLDMDELSTVLLFFDIFLSDKIELTVHDMKKSTLSLSVGFELLINVIIK